MSTDDISETSGYPLDGESQLQPEDTLVGTPTGDVLDEGYTPPDRYRGVTGFGLTAEEQEQGESIEQRLRQEEPEEGTAYGAPDDDHVATALNNDTAADMQERVGGDDLDSIPADADVLGGGDLSGSDSGPSDIDEIKSDDQQEILAERRSLPTESAEEAALHIEE